MHPQQRGSQRRVGFTPGQGLRILVAVIRLREVLRALERAAPSAQTLGGGIVERHVSPHRKLAIQIAAQLENERQELARAQILGIANEEPLDHPLSSRPVVIEDVRLRLIGRRLGVELWRGRPQRLIDGIRARELAPTRIDAREPELLHPIGRRAISSSAMRCSRRASSTWLSA